MAEYINIKGQSIEVVASDPANPTLGQIWYNSTSNTLKGLGVSSFGSWATGNNMNTARDALAGAGIQTAALAFGGETSPSPVTASTEEYDGSVWTNGGSQPAGNSECSALGTQTNALGLVGTTAPSTFNGAVTIYDGTSWAADSFLNTIRYYGGSSGSTPVGITFGGNTPSVTGATEEYTVAGAAVTKTITVS